VAVTVNQNLLWAEQVKRKPKQWSLKLIAGDEPLEIGEVSLPSTPTGPLKRLSFLAVELGRTSDGNVVYVNGASDAEKVALQIYEALGPEYETSDQSVADLRELVQKTIHPKYQLAEVLKRGVAFHYGNMPLLVRAEVEQLFKSGVIRYLVCTSTLLEGVNLPCQNLFVRGPKKGRHRLMEPADFWNLAGRAGRWGKEFEGNIVCLDVHDPKLWAEPPVRRTRRALRRSSDASFEQLDEFIAYITSGDGDVANDRGVFESTFSFLASKRVSKRDLVDVPAMRALAPADRKRLEDAIDLSLETVNVPSDLIARHAGISPVSIQRLADRLARESDPSELRLAPPASDDALSSYLRALAIVTATLTTVFGGDKRQYVLGRLITMWMRGVPLSWLIGDRVRYFAKADPRKTLASIIRETMADVEEFARFQAPRYLACYQDVLRDQLDASGIDVDETDDPDVVMMLELGVSSGTALSLMTLGLSRTTAIAVADLIADDDMSAEDCRAWLAARDLTGIDLPALVLREVERTVTGRATSS
jgi:hypothetical protein